MIRCPLRTALLASTLLMTLAQGVRAHEHESMAGGEEARLAQGKVGDVTFPISCNAPAQSQFNRAVAILHSFWYEEALKAFKAVADTDPNCAMAYGARP